MSVPFPEGITEQHFDQAVDRFCALLNAHFGTRETLEQFEARMAANRRRAIAQCPDEQQRAQLLGQDESIMVGRIMRKTTKPSAGRTYA
jgi:hypothetical protein